MKAFWTIELHLDPEDTPNNEITKGHVKYLIGRGRTATDAVKDLAATIDSHGELSERLKRFSAELRR
jgi:hypothetical protein